MITKNVKQQAYKKFDQLWLRLYNNLTMLINLTNHPSKNWSDVALEDIKKQYGEIIDMGFPYIEPFWENEDEKFCNIAREYRDKLIAMKPDAVLLMGEWKITVMLINELIKRGVKVLCTASNRNVKVTKEPDGSTRRLSVFEYDHLREYRYLGDKK